MGYAKTQAGFDTLRDLFVFTHLGCDVKGGRYHAVRGEIQGRCDDGRFVLSTPQVDDFEPKLAGILYCEADILPADLELRDHLTVDLEIEDRAKVIAIDTLTRLIDEQRFHSMNPSYPYIRARVIRVVEVDRTYRIATPAICHALAPLGIESHGGYWDWRRGYQRWRSHRSTRVEGVTLFANFEGTRAVAELCILTLNAGLGDWRPGIPGLLEAITLVARARDLPPFDDRCVRAIHDATRLVTPHYAVLPTSFAPEVRIRLVAGSDGRAEDDAVNLQGPWAATVVSVDAADEAAFIAYSPKLAFREGMLVHHATFGRGIVVAVQPTTAEVKFGAAPPRRLVHRR